MKVKVEVEVKAKGRLRGSRVSKRSSTNRLGIRKGKTAEDLYLYQLDGLLCMTYNSGTVTTLNCFGSPLIISDRNEANGSPHWPSPCRSGPSGALFPSIDSWDAVSNVLRLVSCCFV